VTGVFLLGLLAGIALARVWPSMSVSSPTSVADTGAHPPSAAILAWRDYRFGERALDAEAFTPAQIEAAWLDYRAGERKPLHP
jgi:hypothetical protein